MLVFRRGVAKIVVFDVYRFTAESCCFEMRHGACEVDYLPNGDGSNNASGDYERNVRQAIHEWKYVKERQAEAKRWKGKN